MFFVEHTSNKELYQYIADQLRLLTNNSFVIINSFEQGNQSLIIRAIAGSSAELRTFHSLFDDKPTGKFLQINTPFYSRNISRKNRLYKLWHGAIEERTCQKINDIFSPLEIINVPLTFKEEFLGNVIVLTLSPLPPLKTKLIQAFINQASVALKRKRSEDGIIHSAKEWRITFDSITDMIAVIDKDFHIIRANKAFARAFDKEPLEVIGHYCHEIIHGDQIPMHPCLQKEVLATQKSITWEFYDHCSGKHREISVIPIFNETREIHKTIHIIKDITEQKKAEEILKRDRESLTKLVKEKTEELLGTQKELENARRLSDIGILAATIAHEIRNPLEAIKTAAYNIRRKSQNPQLDGHIANIDKKVMESDQIIKNLLSYSRIKLPNYEWFSIKDLLVELTNFVAEKYSRGNVRQETDFQLPDGIIMEADPIHIRVLLSNLLDNAYQSISEKSGLLQISVTVKDSNKIRVRIKDNGIGIDKEDLQRISEPFFTKKSKGIGLGLTICSQIVNLHNGTIIFESEKGKGTTVTVTLPLRRREQ
jgi:PAS domain S-box-containing protein